MVAGWGESERRKESERAKRERQGENGDEKKEKKLGRDDGMKEIRGGLGCATPLRVLRRLSLFNPFFFF